MDEVELVSQFTERELKLIRNCIQYAESEQPAGLPGHNLIIIISKFAFYRGVTLEEISDALLTGNYSEPD